MAWLTSRGFTWRRALLAAGLAGALVLPFQIWGFTAYQFTFAGVYAIAILGLSLLCGQVGQISLGHGAFYGLGAYTTAVLMDRWGISAYATFPVAAALCFTVGFGVGFAVLRLNFFYIALTTYALAMAVPQILKTSHLAPLTGGVQGLYLERPGPPFGLPLTMDQWWYFVTGAVLLALLWLAHNLINSRTGRAVRAIRDNPTAARAAGIDLRLYKATIFGVSAAFTGIAGSLGALLLDFIAPDSFTFWLSIMLLVGAVIGGMGTVWGALAGGLMLQFWPDAAALVSRDLALPVFGAALIMVAWFLPHGVAGWLDGVIRRLDARRAAAALARESATR
jgi:branched-chain amino acid transport system permease protein